MLGRKEKEKKNPPRQKPGSVPLAALGKWKRQHTLQAGPLTSLVRHHQENGQDDVHPADGRAPV